MVGRHPPKKSVVIADVDSATRVLRAAIESIEVAPRANKVTASEALGNALQGLEDARTDLPQD